MKFSQVSQVSELTGWCPSLVHDMITAGRKRYYSEEDIIHYLKELTSDDNSEESQTDSHS